LVESATQTVSLGQAGSALAESENARCYHCGEPCRNPELTGEGKVFCCQGCLFVHELLSENSLEQFYALSRHPGVRVENRGPPSRFAFLDEPTVEERLVDFTDSKLSRVTFHIPAIHCAACVWLLENLFRLRNGIGKSQVNFARREVSICFARRQIKLSEVAAFLSSLGYEPDLTFGALDRSHADPDRKKRWLKLGLAGFGFGNIMLLSLPLYTGLDSTNAPLLRVLFGYLSLALAAPVLVYSGSDYWRSAFASLRQKTLTLDAPLAAGMAALYAQSAFEIVSGRGGGYLDSLTGLVFFLLCGRAFQRLTNERLVFDRDYRSFFPLAVTRRSGADHSYEESVAIHLLCVGDPIVVRNGELIPADSRLLSGEALIDYSFVTGEAQPVSKTAGDYLYAGGRQVGGAIELQIEKPVSQSYLASLWAHDAFRKERCEDLNSLTNRYSRRFTVTVLAVAVSAVAFWAFSGDPGKGLKAFFSVLIVACPCALALAAPFTLGTVQRALARRQVFFKNPLVLERLADVTAIIFDKTGTLTGNGPAPVVFRPVVPGAGTPKLAGKDAGAPGALDCAYCLARHSTHPLATAIANSLASEATGGTVEEFEEIPGCGLAGRVRGQSVRLGSRAWLEGLGVKFAKAASTRAGAAAFLAIDGLLQGAFVVGHSVRPEMDRLLSELGARFEMALLSGDNEKEREQFRRLFGSGARLYFNQSPVEKLEFVQRLQQQGHVVMMVGDGLNDAGALKQSDVGVAVVEQNGAFSPASDMIIPASEVAELGRIIRLAGHTRTIVCLNFAISALYNVAGISIASAGLLSPVFCAVLMPLSSITVVSFACGAAALAARKLASGNHQT
jgi:P-type Cu+ transporter